ncbi:MAG TPA: ATP-binding cassette domain-containing protein, partial [Terrimicrobiaceae bacterium]
MSESFIEFKGITKTFGGVIALKDVTLNIARGECHGLMGENGAGKSTLGKVLAGIHKPDSGEMKIDGKEHNFS